MLSKLTKIMERKASDQKYADFWEQEEDFDVLFMGTSHVINGVFPMDLWNDYGIVSYNFGGHGNEIATTYWVMENALKETTPKVMVIDCLGIDIDHKTHENFSYVHLSLDTFPLSITKIKTVCDLLDDPVLDRYIASNGESLELGSESRTKIGLLWTYSVYHSRWNEINEMDFRYPYNYEKGAESRIAVTVGELNKISNNEKIEGGTVSEKYLRKMIEECQSKGIEVLLTYLPFTASENEQKAANYVYDIAKEYDVGYLNFFDMDIINYHIDMYDEDSHVNPSGARKITDYIGKYLIENYNISDRRNDSKYTFWNADFEEYNLVKNNNLVSRQKLDEYLMLLYNDDVEIRMEVKNKDIFNNQLAIELFENLGVDKSKLSGDTDFIIIRDRGKEAYVINGIKEDNNTQQSVLGTISYITTNDENKLYHLYLENQELLAGETDDDTGIRIDIYRNNVIVDSVKFKYSVDGNSIITTQVIRKN